MFPRWAASYMQNMKGSCIFFCVDIWMRRSGFACQEFELCHTELKWQAIKNNSTPPNMLHDWEKVKQQFINCGTCCNVLTPSSLPTSFPPSQLTATDLRRRLLIGRAPLMGVCHFCPLYNQRNVVWGWLHSKWCYLIFVGINDKT